MKEIHSQFTPVHETMFSTPWCRKLLLFSSLSVSNYDIYLADVISTLIFRISNASFPFKLDFSQTHQSHENSIIHNYCYRLKLLYAPKDRRLEPYSMSTEAYADVEYDI